MPGHDRSAASARYRFAQELWNASFTELGFAQQDAATLNSTFAFARAGADNALTVVVLSNDYARRAVTLRGLPAAARGRELCDIERVNTCITVSGSGRAAEKCIRVHWDGVKLGKLLRLCVDIEHRRCCSASGAGPDRGFRLPTKEFVSCAGTLDVTLGGQGEPWVLVDPFYVRSNEFFSRPKQVRNGHALAPATQALHAIHAL